MSAEELLTFVRIAVSLGTVTALAASVKYLWNRRRWRSFKMRCRQWNEYVQESEIDHPKEMKDADWQVFVERMLEDSWFSPLEIQRILDLDKMLLQIPAHINHRHLEFYGSTFSQRA